MREKTLLEEIEVDQILQVEKKLEDLKKESIQIRQKENSSKSANRKELFSAASFPMSEIERLKEKYKSPDEEINKIESKVSQIIEKPNYDYMETLSEKQRKKIFSVQKEDTQIEAKPKKKKLKMIIVSILFAIFGTWGVVNIATIDNVSSQIAQVSTLYKINFATYLKNLYTLDATNSENMKNLFQTIPEDVNAPNTIAEKSNWFDRICNFLEGLFGG